jgi:hypothetical protein
MKGAYLGARERRGFRSGFREMGGFLNGAFLKWGFLYFRRAAYTGDRGDVGVWRGGGEVVR